MLTVVLRRMLLSLVTLLGLAVFVFWATEVLPGDALDVTLSADELSGLSAERLAAMKQELGLDRPALERLGAFITGLVTLDFGTTIISRTPVTDIVMYPMRNSLALALVVFAIAAPLALAAGVGAAVFHRRAVDHAVGTATIVGYSIPEFVIGTGLVVVLAVVFPVFPATITANTRDPLAMLVAASPLAVATVLIGSIAHLTRLLRVGMVEALASELVERLRLMGVPEWRIVWCHALPAAILPTLMAMALYAAALVSGIVVVELVFAYPGLGQELVRGVVKREMHVIQAITLMSAAIVVGFNLVADLAILALDPRVRRP